MVRSYRSKRVVYPVVFTLIGGGLLGGPVHVVGLLSELHGFWSPSWWAWGFAVLGAVCGLWLARGAAQSEDRAAARLLLNKISYMAERARAHPEPPSLWPTAAWESVCERLDRMSEASVVWVLAHAKAELEALPPTVRLAPLPWTQLALAGKPPASWGAVRAVRLREQGLDARGVIRLMDCPSMATIVAMDLSLNPIGDQGLGVLSASPLMPAMRHLALNGCGITDAGLRALALDSPRTSLRVLELRGNDGIGDEGMTALAGAPFFESLEAVEVDTGHLAEATRARIESKLRRPPGPWEMA